MSKKRILLGASHSVIEPLGLLHLGGTARDLGWERKFHLVKEHDFEPFFEAVKDFKPDMIGFNVYTGNHLQLHEALHKIKKDHPNIGIIAGGPHATYFPSETANFADYVVMSEGFGALQKILKGEANPGILPLQDVSRFPQPDRATFYADYPEHANSRIKSVITMTGCPFYCSYCYNASKPSNIKDNMPPEVAEALVKKLGPTGRLFPQNIRDINDVIAEGREIRERWPTEVIYFQDDVHGFNLDWMAGFADRWPKEVGIPYHAQIRWEMTKQKERLDLFAKGGCFGLTLAIEAADPVIRSEVLNRHMPNDIMFTGMKEIINRGMRVRTEQITGLPYGFTSKETPINLEADLELVKLNVDLREFANGPTMAWASTLAPYKGTNMGEYCETHGHYVGDNSDVPDTFFDRSVLRFPKAWVGSEIGSLRNKIAGLEKIHAPIPHSMLSEYKARCAAVISDSSAWLSASELERYRDQNAELRRIFNFVTLVPRGHDLARNYLDSTEGFSYERLGRETIHHLKSLSSHNSDARKMLDNIDLINGQIKRLNLEDVALERDLQTLSPYFASIPLGDRAVVRAVEYARKKVGGNGVSGIGKIALSTAIRHHLYDNVLYSTEGTPYESHNKNFSPRQVNQERYPPKV